MMILLDRVTIMVMLMQLVPALMFSDSMIEK